MTDKFLNGIRSIKKDKISPADFEQARRTFIDYLAVTIAGASYFRSECNTYLDALDEKGDADVIGLGRKASMQAAALLNGMNAHVIELDDGHRRGAVHVGATLYSALLSVARHENLSSEDFLYGAVIGYEASVRLACAVQPGNKIKGYHATGTCGTVGAALGIAAAMGQTFEQMKATLSAAVTSAAGLLEMQEDNSDLKPLNVGRAAMDAVAAAYIGKCGFQSPGDAIGGKRGFLKVMTDQPNTEFITVFSQNAPLAISRIYQKTYAACRHAHPAIEASLLLRSQVNDLSTVESIKVEAYKLAVSGHDHTHILGVSSAKMSIPFCVALALVRGSAGVGDYTDVTVKDETILSLARKVSVVESPELTALLPDKRASVLTLAFNDGKVISRRVDYPKGEPENPLNEDELREKFVSLAGVSGVPEDTCSLILNQINSSSFEVSNILDMMK